MKRLGPVALISCFASISLLGGCENSSRLDKGQNAAPQNRGDKPAAQGDHSGSVEDRVARLEDFQAKYGETLEWVDNIRKQQQAQAKAQQQQREREEPDPDAVFAVDVAPDVKLGQVEGPADALVTIVEAWDFA